MKITAQTTSTGNYAVLTPTGELLKLSKRNQYNYCTLTGEAVADYLQKTAKRPKIDIELTNDHVINEYFLTDESAKKDWQIEKLNGKLAKWNFDFEKSTITVQTETEDVFFTFYSYQRIKSIEDDIQYDKYILDTGGAIYVDNNINGSQFLQIIYCKDDKQYIFRNK